MRTLLHAIGRRAVALLLLAGVGVLGCGRSETPLTLVFTPSRDPTALKEAGDAFAKTLAEISGVPVRALVASDYAGVIEALRSKRVELAFVHPVGYVLANREAGCRILVRDIGQDRLHQFYVRKDRGIRRVRTYAARRWPSWIPRRPRATSTRW
jgi:phosphonate transport system substrate-binding protein